MTEYQNNILDLKDLARLYAEKAGKWLLLEILETDKENNPTKLRLITHSASKEQLHEHLSEDSEWEWKRRYLIVLADPTKPCTLSQWTD